MKKQQTIKNQIHTKEAKDGIEIDKIGHWNFEGVAERQKIRVPTAGEGLRRL
jgi:hypothetical protein